MIDCEHWEDMAAGNEKFLAALRGGPSPTKLRWRQATLTCRPIENGENMRRMQSRVEALTEEKEKLASQVVSRDPCWKCGVRGDVGCSCG